MTRVAIDPATLVYLAGAADALIAPHQLVAPSSIRARALDLLLIGVRDGRLSSSDALALHERMTELKLRALGDRVSRRTAWDIAIAHGSTSVQDAEYVAVAKLQADVLVTADRSLVALAKGIVPVAKVKDVFSP